MMPVERDPLPGPPALGDGADSEISVAGTICVTGGCGFIGSALVREWLRAERGAVLNIDKLTYAGTLANLGAFAEHPLHHFAQLDIADDARILELLRRHRPRVIVHLAAESHVDRSILAPAAFVETNVLGTQRLLSTARQYYGELDGPEQALFRFLHVSTDEVYGSLQPCEEPCDEMRRYAPNSPYAASKAAADHLVRAYHRTYGLPTLVTNCTNNFGPYQNPEKLIPLAITHALAGKSIPIYGDGRNVRDWLAVEDHVDALCMVLARGTVDRTYHVSARAERENLEIVERICDLVDEISGRVGERPRRALISLVGDRPGHDRRYALDATRLTHELGWRPRRSFEAALRDTVAWYIDQKEWRTKVGDERHKSWLRANYAERR